MCVDIIIMYHNIAAVYTLHAVDYAKHNFKL